MTKWEEEESEAAKALVHANAVTAKYHKELEDKSVDDRALEKRYVPDPHEPWYHGDEEAVERAQEAMLESDAVRKHVADMRAEFLKGHVKPAEFWFAVKNMNNTEAKAMKAVVEAGRTPGEVRDIHKRSQSYTNSPDIDWMVNTHTDKANMEKEKAIELALKADWLLDHARIIQAKYNSSDWNKPGTLGGQALALAINRYTDVLHGAHKAAKYAFWKSVTSDKPPDFETYNNKPKVDKRDLITAANVTEAVRKYDEEREEADNAAEQLAKAREKADQRLYEDAHPKPKPKPKKPKHHMCNWFWCGT